MFENVKSQKICKSQDTFKSNTCFYYLMKVEDTCWRKIKLLYFRICKNLVFSTSCYKKTNFKWLEKSCRTFFFSCYLPKIQHSLNEWKNEAKSNFHGPKRFQSWNLSSKCLNHDFSKLSTLEKIDVIILSRVF